MFTNNRFLSGLAILLLAGSFLGCDMVEKIKGDFSKDKKPAAAKSTQAVKPVKSIKDGPMPANALARIDNWMLTKEEFSERLSALKEVVPDFDVDNIESRKLVLEELVRQQLLIQDAEQTGLANSKDIKEAVEEFRRTLVVREMARIKTENLTVSDDEAMEFYNSNKELLVEPLELNVSEIVLETQEEATQILAQILQGASFADMARQYSISESASKGGELGFITDVPFQQMGAALITLEEGGVSSVFSGPDGFYLMKVNEKKGGTQIPFDEIKDDIIQNQTLIKQQQTILDYIQGLEDKYKVELNENLL